MGARGVQGRWGTGDTHSHGGGGISFIFLGGSLSSMKSVLSSSSYGYKVVKSNSTMVGLVNGDDFARKGGEGGGGGGDNENFTMPTKIMPRHNAGRRRWGQ